MENAKSVLKCLYRKPNCDGPECFSEELCLEPGIDKHCYSMFKKSDENKTVQYDNIVFAGCWNGDIDCQPPKKINEKFLSEYKTNVSPIVSEFLLRSESQNKCISYYTPPEPSSYRTQNNLSFCCCSTNMCNNDILFTNEKSPNKILSQMIRERTQVRVETLTTKTTKSNLNVNLNTALIISLILISLLFLMLLVVLTFKKKFFIFKSKSELPDISYEAANGQSRAQFRPSPIQISLNQKSDFKNELLKQNHQSNDEFRHLTQPLLNPANETLYFQNIVPPNLDVLPESILKKNPVINFQSLPQNVEIVNRKDHNELENFKARLEEQLAKSSKSSSIDPIDLNILPLPIRPCDIYLIEKVSQGQFSSVWKGRCLNNKEDDNQVPEYAIKIFSHLQKSSWSNEKDIYYSMSTINPYILTHFSSDLNHLPKNDPTPSFTFSSNEYWIITEYHSNGSLCDFLRINLLSWPQMVRLVNSILEGLAYLHSESIDPKKQFAIAHRDLKSKNILVKKDGQTCCIADFGLALKLSNHNKLNGAEIRSKVHF